MVDRKAQGFPLIATPSGPVDAESIRKEAGFDAESIRKEAGSIGLMYHCVSILISRMRSNTHMLHTTFGRLIIRSTGSTANVTKILPPQKIQYNKLLLWNT